MSDRDSILRFLQNHSNSTAASIARYLGKTKLSQSDKDCLQELIDQGEVDENTSGRYATYSVDGEEEEETPSPAEVQPVEVKTSKSVPAFKLEGFKAEWTDDDKLRVTAPDGATYDLENDDNILVINGRVEFIIKTPADVLAAITDYTTEQGVQTFTIRDIIENKEIKNAGDIVLNEGRILCFKIEKHNKAA